VKIHLIGDCHAKISRLLWILDSLPKDEPVFQLGDMGVGFSGIFLPKRDPNFWWIRGNHDCPEKCRAHENYLGDYGYLEDLKLFYVAGAWSIDYASRVRGVSWWPDEELGYEQLQDAIDLYKQTKPEIVISHECPTEVGIKMLAPLMLDGYFGAKASCGKSRTARALQVMFEAHQPQHWVFGHYHIDRDIYLKVLPADVDRFADCSEGEGTHFRCVSELGVYTLEV